MAARDLVYRYSIEGGTQAAAEARKFSAGWAQAEQTIIQASAKKTASLEADEERLARVHDQRLRNAIVKQQAYFKSIEALEKSGSRLGLAAGGGAQLSSFQAEERAIRARAAALRDEEDAARRLNIRKEALLQQIDPLYAAQSRYNNEVREAKMLLEANAITADQFSMAERRAAGALEEATRAAQRNMAANRANRAALNNLSFQVGDIAQQIALGTPGMIIFAQQSGQVTGALSGLNLAGKAGVAGALSRVIGILGSPWGQALTTAGVLALAFSGSMNRAKGSADELTDAQKRLKEAIETLEKAEGKYVDTQENVIKKAIRRVEALLLVEKQTRATTKATIDAALAEVEASRIRSSGPGQRGELGTLALDFNTQRLSELQALQRANDEAIRTNEARLRGGYAALALETTVAAATDKTVAATLRYNQAIATLTRQRTQDKITQSEFEAAAIREAQNRDATIKAIRDETSERNKNEAAVRKEMATVAQARKAILELYPNAHIGSGLRTRAQQNALIARGVTKATNSFHLKGQAIDVDPIAGVTFEDFVASIKAKGFNIVEAKNERGGPNDGTGAHWHIAWSGGREAVSTLRDMEKAQDSYATQLKNDLDAIVGKYDLARQSAETYAEEIEKIQLLEKAGLISPNQSQDYRSKALYAKLGIDPKADQAAIVEGIDQRRDRAMDFVGGQLSDISERREMLKLEASLSGETINNRERELLLLRVKLDYLRSGGEAEDAALKILQATTGELYDQETAWSRIRAAQDEFQQVGERTLDQIFDPQNWRNWGDLGKSILKDLEADFIRLALLNPIKNALFDSGLQTLTSVLGAFGGNKSIANIGKNATGTEYFSGGATWVGENGPEVVSLPRGSKVHTAAESRRMIGSGDAGLPPVNIHMPIDATGADAAGLARLERQVAELERTLPATIVTVWQDARDRRLVN